MIFDEYTLDSVLSVAAILAVSAIVVSLAACSDDRSSVTPVDVSREDVSPLADYVVSSRGTNFGVTEFVPKSDPTRLCVFAQSGYRSGLWCWQVERLVK